MTDGLNCDVPGCEEPYWAYDFCKTHAEPYRHIKPPDSAVVREWIMARVEFAGECWVWTRQRNQSGYGHAFPPRKWGVYATGAHRVVYQLLVGPIPEGFVIHHRCGVRPCVNPAHLLAMSEENHHDHHEGRSPRVEPVRMSRVKWAAS